MNEQAFELLLEKHRESDRRQERIEQKVDELLAFKWQMLGGTVVISILFNLGLFLLKWG